jgi:hypothetical protein
MFGEQLGPDWQHMHEQVLPNKDPALVLTVADVVVVIVVVVVIRPTHVPLVCPVESDAH